MRTPIADFVRDYDSSGAHRLHMPGHKGVGEIERLDITEIEGADSLYEASGIICESEENASSLFGAPTYYTTEGSSHAIRAMLYLLVKRAKKMGVRPRILAARNVHKVFVGAAALLDIEVEWLFPTEASSYLYCPIDPDALRARLDAMCERPVALYLTSPDYLGSTADIRAIAEVCHAYGVLLAVDCAHGAYLRFLTPSRHPIDLGADLCCTSAHKTLPVLTGGAYLHLRADAPIACRNEVKHALALFGSTSPSYLTLTSLDRANAYLADGYRERLALFIKRIDAVKATLSANGYTLWGDEPLKITLCPKSYGYLGGELAAYLYECGIVTEFSDPDFTVLMLTPELTEPTLTALVDALLACPKREAKDAPPPVFRAPKVACPPKEALLCAKKTVSLDNAEGKILGQITVGCPPAVPILMLGERIDRDAIATFRYYNVRELSVIDTDFCKI